MNKFIQGFAESVLSYEEKNRYSTEAHGIEYEIEIYLHGYDIEQIRSLSVSTEEQEQWGIYVPKTEKNAADGTIRVRRTTIVGGETKYEQTTKIKSGHGKLEHEVLTDEVLFGMFKRLADQGLCKTRYRIPHKTKEGVDVVLECDVFKDKVGNDVEWVKIDVELEEGTKFSIEDIPFKHDQIYFVTPEMKTEKDPICQTVQELYNKYFVSENVFVSKED